MKAIFSVLGLVIVVAVIGLMARKQASSVAVPQVPVAPGQPAPAAGTTPKQQMDQLKQGLETTLQQPRPGEEQGK
jgi:cytochrome c-type biogenesis protein CcmH/NrfG